MNKHCSYVTQDLKNPHNLQSYMSILNMEKMSCLYLS